MSKLRALVNSLLIEVPIVEADVNDRRALFEMCKQTKIILNCVGPVRNFFLLSYLFVSFCMFVCVYVCMCVCVMCDV